MASLKLTPGRDRALITKGEYEGQAGDVSGYDPGTRKYTVKIRHEGWPENHYHHVRVRARHLEKME